MLQHWYTAPLARSLLLLTLLCTPFSTQAVPDTKSTEIFFGVYQSDKASMMYKSFAPIVQALEGGMRKHLSTHVTIKLKIFKTYEEGLDSLVTSKVDFVRFGPASYILAKEQNPDIALLAMEVKSGNKRHFKGHIIVPNNSTIQSLEELKGKRFAFGNRNSTIGRFLSQATLVEHGIRAADLAHYEYLGQHDKVAAAVQLNDYDAGAVKAKTFRKFSKKGGVRSIAHFDVVTKPWIASSALDPAIRSALSQALIELSDPKVLSQLKVQGFAATSHQTYQAIQDKIAQAKQFEIKR